MLGSEEVKDWQEKAMSSNAQTKSRAQKKLQRIKEAVDKGPREKDQAIKHLRKFIVFPEELQLTTSGKKRKAKDEDDEEDEDEG